MTAFVAKDLAPVCAMELHVNNPGQFQRWEKPFEYWIFHRGNGFQMILQGYYCWQQMQEIVCWFIAVTHRTRCLVAV